MHRSFLCSTAIVVVLLASNSIAQSAPNPTCGITPVTTNHGLPDMFTAAQEVELGEVLAQVVEGQALEVDDPELTSYLQNLGDRLTRNLPISDLKFRFHLSNMPVANAFSIAGGRVYVSRKLIGFARSEGELAGVLAHELGHVVTHQTAVDYTRSFKSIVITQVTDRSDIEIKFQQLLESKKRFRASEEERQLEADRVGLELLALAGYKTDAPADFIDRLTNNKGRTGNWFTELFGTTPESSKRLREMQKTMGSFPPACLQSVPQGSSVRFREWQSAVVGYSGTGRRENVPGLLSKKELEPPLQDEVHTLRFSYDGKYILAQDDGSIYVLTREPLAFKFRIEAPDAYPANFTRDSRSVTFYDPELHVEVWDVDAGRRTDVYEVVSSLGCMQTALSPDGRTLACIDHQETLVLIDTTTEERLFERKKIRGGEVAIGQGPSSFRISYEVPFLNMGFSLDSRYLVAAGENVAVAVDVPARHEIPMNGALKPYVQGAFSFIGDRALVGNAKNGSKSAVLSFPEGQVQHQIDLGAAAPFRVAKGNYVLMRPIRDFAVGVLDVRSNNIVRASKTPALDVYDEFAVSMLGSGEVGLFGQSANPIAKVALPRGHFGRLRAAEFSDDLNWLAASTRSRSSVWNLSSGTRMYNLKGFRGACFPDDGNLYVDFPKQGTADRAIVRASLQQNGMTLAVKVDPGRAWQECEYLINLRPKGDNRDAQKDKETEDEDKRDYRFEGSLISWRHVVEFADTNKTLEVRDVQTGTLMWSKTFSKVVPAIYTDASAGVAAFRWRLGADGAKAEAKDLPNIWKPASGGREYDYLVEIVELGTGKFKSAVIVDTADGAFTIKRHLATNDWLVLYDSFGRTLVYSLKSGKCAGKFFGRPRNISPTGTLVVQRSPGRLAIYDLGSMEKTHELVFSFPVSDTHFTRDGKKLILLTNNQVVYVVDPSLTK